MSKSGLDHASTKTPRHFDRHAWAGGYCNVEKELNQVAISPVKGSVTKINAGKINSVIAHGVIA